MFFDEFRVPQWLRLVAGTIVGMVLSGRLTQIMLSLVAGIAIGAVGMWWVQRWKASIQRGRLRPAARHRRPVRLPFWPATATRRG